MNIYTHRTAFNADVYTPVELFLSLRNKHRKVCLMESNDYHARDNSKSFIGLDPIVEIVLKGRELLITIDGVESAKTFPSDCNINAELDELLASFNISKEGKEFNGFFGRIGFEFAILNEKHLTKQLSSLDVPDVHLFVFKYLIVIDHFKDSGCILENSFSKSDFSEAHVFNDLLSKCAFVDLPFVTTDAELADFEDADFEEIVRLAQNEIKQGNVFQLVVSNAFKQSFFGDDFQVYRSLRRLNPSPYLFYFDFEDYRLFGSSPEAQLVVKDGKAEIHPIAGTVPKTECESTNRNKIEFLLKDEKENAEHTMLVDLARNDLSKLCTAVKVETYKEVQFFSHVIHLVSKVTGDVLAPEPVHLISSSFPAGTLSGTPKPRALELISKFEKTTRDYYGGAIGRIGFDGDVNMAIVIRSLLSKNNVLHFRAGAGVVYDSIPQKEREEVYHKLNAVRTAIRTAEIKKKPETVEVQTLNEKV